MEKGALPAPSGPAAPASSVGRGARIPVELVEAYGSDHGPTEVDVEVEKGLLTIASFSSKVNNGQLNFAGQADLKDKPALLKTPGPMQIAKDIQITNEMTSRLLMYLNPVFAGAVSVGGVVDLNCERLAANSSTPHMIRI